MDKKIGRIAQIIAYITLGYLGFTVLIAIGLIIAGKSVPETIDGMLNFMNVASPLIGVASVILGLCSISQADSSNEQANKILGKATEAAETIATTKNEIDTTVETINGVVTTLGNVVTKLNTISTRIDGIESGIQELRKSPNPPSNYPPPAVPEKPTSPWSESDGID